MQTNDVLDPIEHQVHPLALDQGDETVDTRKDRERAGHGDVRDADPPVEVLRV